MHKDPLDATLDRLLAQQKPVADDFAARALARLHTEAGSIGEPDELLEQTLESALRSAPIEPSHDFTACTLERLQPQTNERKPAKILPFSIPMVARAVGGAAAAITLLISVARVEVADNVPASAPSQVVVREIPPSVPASANAAAGDAYDEASVLLMMLAEGIDENARWAIDENDTSTLLALVR
jgi:hypothetical protein